MIYLRTQWRCVLVLLDKRKVVYSQIQFTLKGMARSGDNDTLVYTGNEGKQGARQEKRLASRKQTGRKKKDQGNKRRKARAVAVE